MDSALANQTAVTAVQQGLNLPPTGMVGPNDAAALLDSYTCDGSVENRVLASEGEVHVVTAFATTVNPRRNSATSAIVRTPSLVLYVVGKLTIAQ